MIYPMQKSGICLQNLKVFDSKRQDSGSLMENIRPNRAKGFIQPDVQVKRILGITVINGNTKILLFFSIGLQITASQSFDKNPRGTDGA